MIASLFLFYGFLYSRGFFLRESSFFQILPAEASVAVDDISVTAAKINDRAFTVFFMIYSGPFTDLLFFL